MSEKNASISMPTAPEERSLAGAEMLRALVRTVQAVRLYGLDHAASMQTASAGAGSMAAALRGSAQLRVRPRSDGLQIDDAEPLTDHGLVEFARACQSANIAAIDFESPLPVDNWLALASALSALYGRVESPAELIATIHERTAGAIRILTVDIANLPLCSASSGAPGPPAGLDWARVVDQALAATEEQLHRLVGQVAELCHATPAPADASGVSTLADAVRQVPADKRAQVLSRLSVILSSLDPSARSQLLNVRSAHAGTDASDLADLAEAIPDQDLARLTGILRTSGAGASAPLSRILDKLSSRAGGVQVPTTTAAPPDSEPAPLGMPMSAETVASINPAEYDARLNEIATQTVLPSATDRVTDVFGSRWTHVGIHAARVAAATITADEPPNVQAPLFRLVRTHFDALVSAGESSLVLAVLQRAGAARDTAKTDDAREFIAGLLDPAWIRRLLSAEPFSASRVSDALAAVQGPDAARKLLEHLVSADLNAVRDRALAVLRTNVFDLPAAVRALVKTGSPLLVRVLGLPLAWTDDELDQFSSIVVDSGHPDLPVHAMSALASANRTWPPSLLRWSIRSGRAGLQHHAIATMEKARVPAYVEILAEYLSLRFRTDWNAGAYRRAARLLAGFGPDGISALSTVVKCVASSRDPGALLALGILFGDPLLRDIAAASGLPPSARARFARALGPAAAWWSARSATGGARA